MPDNIVLREIINFFDNALERKCKGQYYYAEYKNSWLKKIGLDHYSRDEAKASRTTKELQKLLISKCGKRIKTEAPVAEGMTLRFEQIGNGNKPILKQIDSSKLQAFDILDLKTGTAYEISLSDAFAEFFKDVLKALLDSRVKRLCICMRNHYYKGANKSGFARVNDSEMVQQYMSLAKLYKLDIELIDILPSCNENYFD
jgi:hypothetical protein